MRVLLATGTRGARLLHGEIPGPRSGSSATEASNGESPRDNYQKAVSTQVVIGLL
jgi:hypothetical protein